MDILVFQYLEGHPERGERSLIGHIRASNMKFTREQLRSSILRIDPGGLQQRRNTFARRIIRYENLTFISIWNQNIVLFNAFVFS